MRIFGTTKKGIENNLKSVLTNIESKKRKEVKTVEKIYDKDIRKYTKVIKALKDMPDCEITRRLFSRFYECDDIIRSHGKEGVLSDDATLDECKTERKLLYKIITGKKFE